ncbi:acyl-CoA dehydrogenase family protein [candidate division KSB1 bacterium]|nr:acyl-CoA dehydrogenase family protein [candidate division KSB1 bacterium]
MDFSLSEEQQMLVDSTRIFVREKLANRTESFNSYDPALLNEIANLGYCGVTTPVEYNGAGFDSLCLALVVEEIAKVDPAMAARIAETAGPVQHALITFGSEQQKLITENLAAGTKWGTVALWEPEMNQLTEKMCTIAKKSGDSWVLNGTKSHVINAPNADVYLVVAAIDNSDSDDSWIAFLIDKNQSGLHFNQVTATAGTQPLSISHLEFENCKLPKNSVIGTVELGKQIVKSIIADTHMLLAANALGVAEGALELAEEYASVRVQFGKAIVSFEAIRGMLADMAAHIEAVRLLVYRAAEKRGDGKLSAMAKLVACNTASLCVHKSNQIHGGYGYMRDYAIEFLYRDQLFSELFWNNPNQLRSEIADAVTQNS